MTVITSHPNELSGGGTPFIGVNRHRIGVDGEGVTTLAAFHGCPLRCRYCLNPSCLDADARVHEFTPQSLYQQLRIDDLYFVATGGGVCFGGGEPLLRPEFIRQFHALCAGRWKITLETSLNVPLKSLQTVAPLVNDFIIDIKDANDEIFNTEEDRERSVERLSRLGFGNFDRFTYRVTTL